MNRLEPENGSGSFPRQVQQGVEQYVNPLAFDPKSGGGGRNRYKYHDRGDGMYDDARKLGQQPHLVTTGQYVFPNSTGQLQTHRSSVNFSPPSAGTREGRMSSTLVCLIGICGLRVRLQLLQSRLVLRPTRSSTMHRLQLKCAQFHQIEIYMYIGKLVDEYSFNSRECGMQIHSHPSFRYGLSTSSC